MIEKEAKPSGKSHLSIAYQLARSTRLSEEKNGMRRTVKTFQLLLFMYFLTISQAIALSDCPSSGHRHECYGSFTFQDGDTYTGEWLNNRFDGEGEFVWADSGTRYFGGWRNHKRHGKGTTYFSDGNRKVGIWKTGKYVSEIAAKRLTVDQTRPFAKRCAAKVDELKGTYSFHKGIVFDETTHGYARGDEARGYLTPGKFFGVIIYQRTQNVLGETQFKKWACEYLVEDGMDVVRFNPGCNSFHPYLTFTSKDKASWTRYGEYYHYRDQAIIIDRNCG